MVLSKSNSPPLPPPPLNMMKTKQALQLKGEDLPEHRNNDVHFEKQHHVFIRISVTTCLDRWQRCCHWVGCECPQLSQQVPAVCWELICSLTQPSFARATSRGGMMGMWFQGREQPMSFPHTVILSLDTVRHLQTLLHSSAWPCGINQGYLGLRCYSGTGFSFVNTVNDLYKNISGAELWNGQGKGFWSGSYLLDVVWMHCASTCAGRSAAGTVTQTLILFRGADTSTEAFLGLVGRDTKLTYRNPRLRSSWAVKQCVALRLPPNAVRPKVWYLLLRTCRMGLWPFFETFSLRVYFGSAQAFIKFLGNGRFEARL